MTCRWTRDDPDDEGYQIYDTECGHRFEFNEGGPRENHMAFCGYCGGHLVVGDEPDPDQAPLLGTYGE